MYFSRKTILRYVSPSRALQISLVIVYFLLYFLIYFFVYLEWGGKFKIWELEVIFKNVIYIFLFIQRSAPSMAQFAKTSCYLVNLELLEFLGAIFNQ